MKPFWRLGLRTRLLLVGILGVAGALAIGGVALFAALSISTTRTLDDEAAAAAGQVAAMVDSDRVPDPIPISGVQLIQVVDSVGRVVGGSVTADRLTPLLRPAELAQAVAGSALTVDGARAGLAGPLRVVAIAAGPSNNRRDVIVALQIGDIDHSTSVLRTALLVAFPLLLLTLALIAWRVIGWTLRPVEALRVAAERISGSREHERLPVPIAQDEINALAGTLNSMLARLEAAREQQRDFTADAAHELRSPLASIRMQLEVADRLGEAGTLPSEVLQDVDRLSAIIEDLLLLARMDSNDARPTHPATFDAQALLVEVASSYLHADAPVSVVDGPAVEITADRSEIHRALINLTDNAVRHAVATVELSVHDAQRHVDLQVADDGPGIPPADRERVFDRFTRLDDARARNSGGSGLGLAIVRELIDRAGGTVFFTDESSTDEFFTDEHDADRDSRFCATIRIPRDNATG